MNAITDKRPELGCRIERELNTTSWIEWMIIDEWRWRRNKCKCQYRHVQILDRTNWSNYNTEKQEKVKAVVGLNRT